MTYTITDQRGLRTTTTIASMFDFAAFLAVVSPFYFDDDERRESGNTACRSLVATRDAFHAWCNRYPVRMGHAHTQPRSPMFGTVDRSYKGI